jgi:hypothetical protein
LSNFPPQYPNYSAPQPKKSGSKLFLFLGLGCLGLIVLGIVAVVAIVGGGYYMLTHSQAAQTATAFVEKSDAAKAEVGEPVSCTVVGGNVQTDNGANRATINLSASGPKGSATGTVNLSSSGSDSWAVDSAELEGGPSGKTIRLK